MHFQRRRKSELSLNLTPLIDVVFLLLIFFMVTTTFTKETRLSLTLPEATGAPAPSERPEMLEVTVSAKGEYAINGRVVADQTVETLMRAIEKTSKSDNTLPVVITADAYASHQAVITVMDAAGQLGFSRLSLTSQKPAPK